MIRAVALTGPTASGKTALSLALAKALDAEILSLDSMQLYRGMDIGTAKVTQAERGDVPHHMIDILSPEEPFSASDYRELAVRIAKEIKERNKLPLFVGGTGLYLETLKYAETPVPKADPVYTERMWQVAHEMGEEHLWQRLLAVSPEDAEAIHPKNVRRVIRALEIYETTGKTKYEWDRISRLTKTDVDIYQITLDFHDRERLYARIERRIDLMLREGLLDETKGLLDAGVFERNPTAAQAIGYKELFGYLRGECSLSAAREELCLATRHYAKRQLTWFRTHTPDHTLYMDTPEGGMRSVSDLIEEILPKIQAFCKG